MLASPILRSTISLSSQALKTQAPKQVRLSVNPANVKHFARTFMGRIPRVFQWGALLGSIIFWPTPAAYLVKLSGDMDARLKQ